MGDSGSNMGKDRRDGLGSKEKEWKPATDRDETMRDISRIRQRPGIRDVPKNQWGCP